jgi:O-antigen ligase
VQSGSQPDSLSDIVYSLSISSVLILAFFCWFVCGCWSRRFSYRFSPIEFGLCLFAVAAVIAGFAASDKRAAITGSATLLAPILMAVLLVQILDSKSKIKLLLVVIAALGVVSAYQCSSQFFVGNKQLIEFYKENPDEVLAQQNITPNTLKHWQFEHRLHSEKLKNRRPGSSLRPLIICGLGIAVVIFGLVITRSKGAIVASLITAVMFALYLVSGNWLRAHKKAILIACLLLALISGAVVVQYARAHGRLPGGSSMLVRSQYWHATARMYADRPLTGIGPGCRIPDDDFHTAMESNFPQTCFVLDKGSPAPAESQKICHTFCNRHIGFVAAFQANTYSYQNRWCH